MALLLGGLFVICGSSVALAAGPADEMSKDDLYKMILELKKEVTELKQAKVEASVEAASEKQVRAIVQEEVADLVAGEEEEGESLADRIQIHGSFSQGFLMSNNNNWMGNTNDGTTEFNEFTINVSANLTDKLRAGIQLMSRDIGDFGDNDVYVDWALADYSFRDELGVKFGILKMPFGLYNESRDIDSARISVLLPQGFYAEKIRETVNNVIGVGVYGSVDLNQAGTFDYNILAGGNNSLSADGESGVIGENMFHTDAFYGTADSVTISNLFCASLTWFTPLDGLLLNASYLTQDTSIEGYAPTGGGRWAVEFLDFQNVSFGFEYTIGDFILAAEYREGTMPTDIYAYGTNYPYFEMSPMGWYVMGSYRFNDWFATEASYSEFYLDKDKKTDGTLYTWQKIYSINARFDVNEYFIIKAGVNFNSGLGTAFESQQDPNPEEDWILYQLKATVAF